MKCELCGSDRRDSIKYGEFLTKDRIGVHTNCLYLSSAIVQNGKDEEGILGFLPKDIAAEKKRVSTIKCYYCGENMANIGCCEKRCTRTFHMICGIENGALNQFIGTFRSFCHRHIRKVNYRPKPDDECCICYEPIFNDSTHFKAVNMIRAPCCRNGWFHKYCLQHFANNAGYFFKCPLCNDSKKFKENLSWWGIFVQNKDAEWELIPNAYSELLERPSVCAAETCHNSNGRTHQQKSNPFLYCVTCGSIAMHRHCAPQRSHSFECDNCKSILHADSGQESMSSQQLYVGQSDWHDEHMSDAENSDVDVCGGASEEEDAYDENKRQNHENCNLLQKIHVVNDFDGNAFECNEISKNTIHTIEVGEKTDANDKGLENIVKEKKEAHNSRECKFVFKDLEGNTLTIDAPISSPERQCHERNNDRIVSCIAQRTRRKSLKMCLPSNIIESQESTDDDNQSNQSTSLYKSFNCFQVFEYDDSGDTITDNTKTAEVCSTALTNHKTVNSPDNSCIAKRKRHRYLNKSEDKTEVKSEVDQNSVNSDKSSNKPHQGSDIIVNIFSDDSDTETLPHDNGDNNHGSLMNYFYKLLHEVKCNSQMKHKQTKINKADKTDNNGTKPDIKCIANCTRRRFNSVNLLESIIEIDEEIAHSKPAANNYSNSSSQKSCESTTYFDNTIEHQNTADFNLNCHDTVNVNKAKKTVNRKRCHDEEHKYDLTACTSTKKPAITKNDSNYNKIAIVGNSSVSLEHSVNEKVEMKPEGQEDTLVQSCIENRERRKSMDVNHLKKFTDIASRKQRCISIDEHALSNCTLTPNSSQSKSSHSNKALTSPANECGQRRRVSSRRVLESDSVYGTHKSMLGNSPPAKYANWSYIKETTGAYITHHGKLKSALKESAQKRRHTVAAAQTHFTRSYQLLVECNENHYASTSRSAQLV